MLKVCDGGHRFWHTEISYDSREGHPGEFLECPLCAEKRRSARLEASLAEAEAEREPKVD